MRNALLAISLSVVLVSPCAGKVFTSSFNGKPKAPAFRVVENTVAFGLPLNKRTVRFLVLRLDDPVASGQDALVGSGDYPWYDEDSDGIRRIEVEEEDEPSTTTTVRAGGAAIELMAWLGLALVLAVIIALLVWSFLANESRSDLPPEDDVDEDRRRQIDRLEALPFQVKRPDADLLAEARRHYEQGNYGEAIIYLFSHQLVQLDKSQHLTLDKGKTNRQYLRELGAIDGLRDILEQTTLAFEHVFFGRHKLPRERFEACWSELSRFDRLLQRAPV